MIDPEAVFDALCNCVSERKCKGCAWKRCEQFKQRMTKVPTTLLLDAIELIKETFCNCGECVHAEKTDVEGLVICQIDNRSRDTDMYCGRFEQNIK